MLHGGGDEAAAGWRAQVRRDRGRRCEQPCLSLRQHPKLRRTCSHGRKGKRFTAWRLWMPAEWGFRRRDAVKIGFPELTPCLKREKALRRPCAPRGSTAHAPLGRGQQCRAGVPRGQGWRRLPRGSARRLPTDTQHRYSLKSADQATASTAGDACW